MVATARVPPAVARLKRLIDGDELGPLYYLYGTPNPVCCGQ